VWKEYHIIIIGRCTVSKSLFERDWRAKQGHRGGEKLAGAGLLLLGDPSITTSKSNCLARITAEIRASFQ